ncbi:MAG: hypothetical protein K1X28_00005 [Parachlamydiales bacterium]|nr:hypothetical protein [Parachlamydiales bacterium]
MSSVSSSSSENLSQLLFGNYHTYYTPDRTERYAIEYLRKLDQKNSPRMFILPSIDPSNDFKPVKGRFFTVFRDCSGNGRVKTIKAVALDNRIGFLDGHILHPSFASFLKSNQVCAQTDVKMTSQFPLLQIMDKRWFCSKPDEISLELFPSNHCFAITFCSDSDFPYQLVTKNNSTLAKYPFKLEDDKIRPKNAQKTCTLIEFLWDKSVSIGIYE